MFKRSLKHPAIIKSSLAVDTGNFLQHVSEGATDSFSLQWFLVYILHILLNQTQKSSHIMKDKNTKRNDSELYPEQHFSNSTAERMLIHTETKDDNGL